MFHLQIIFKTPIGRVTGRLQKLKNGQITGFVIRVSTWCFLEKKKKRKMSSCLSNIRVSEDSQ